MLKWPHFSRTLVLDGQVNLSEADLIYTPTLLNDEEYGGADILILGGGDGALRHSFWLQNQAQVM